MLHTIKRFVFEDIWTVSLKDVQGAKGVWIGVLRGAVLATRVFVRTECQQKASALTFFTLLSIVPVAALVFGIAKGFGVENLLERQLLENLQGQQEAVRRIIDFARNMITTMRGGVITGIGIATLLWTVVKMLGNIEDAFNAIWELERPRSLGRKFSDYLSAMLICPILAIMAGSITVTIASEAQTILRRFAWLESAGPVLAAFLALLPYVFIWALFSFLYVFMPNTRVRIAPGIIAGIIAGTAYQLMQWVYIKFQIGIAGYNAVYGGFAALPLFLVWLQASWTIVLFGAAISWACQEVRAYDYDTGSDQISGRQKKQLALLVMQVIVKTFEAGDAPPTAESLAVRLQSPLRLLRDIFGDLAACGLVVSTPDGYLPARSPNAFTISAVIDAFEGCGATSARICDPGALAAIQERVAAFRRLAEAAPENIRLKDMPDPR